MRRAEAGYARGGSAPRAQGCRVRPSRHKEKSNALERKVGRAAAADGLEPTIWLYFIWPRSSLEHRR
eukprot:7134781-Prymnesium_polylepis.1